MSRANLAALGKTAGILDAPALTGVFRFTEVFLINADRVHEESNDQAQKYRHDNQDVFHCASHFIAHSLRHGFVH